MQQQGKLQMLGIIQEQHPERCRLFMQWKQVDWPVLTDPLNLLGVGVVPITLAIDEHGVVRAVLRKPDQLKDFVDQAPPQAGPAPAVA
ncbi:MAG: TlpA family protein disulfide reductase, partial [Planctomycetota bacterium]